METLIYGTQNSQFLKAHKCVVKDIVLNFFIVSGMFRRLFYNLLASSLQINIFVLSNAISTNSYHCYHRQGSEFDRNAGMLSLPKIFALPMVSCGQSYNHAENCCHSLFKFCIVGIKNSMWR